MPHTSAGALGEITDLEDSWTAGKVKQHRPLSVLDPSPVKTSSCRFQLLKSYIPITECQQRGASHHLRNRDCLPVGGLSPWSPNVHHICDPA